jgi:hypothetical protein
MVDFPDPEAPTIPTVYPGIIVNESLSRTF